MIAQHPHAGRQRDDLRPGLRSFVVDEFIIVYRLEGPLTRVLHIMRGSRDIRGLLGE